MTFLISIEFFSENISWPVLMNIQMSNLMLSFPRNFLHISFTEMTKISYFSYETGKLTFYPTKINEKWGLFLHILIQGYDFTCICKKWKMSTFHIIYMTNCEGMTSPTHSYEYSWGLVKKCFPKKMWNFKMSYLILTYFGILWCWGLKLPLMCPLLLDLIGVGKGCTLVGGISNAFAAHS